MRSRNLSLLTLVLATSGILGIIRSGSTSVSPNPTSSHHGDFARFCPYQTPEEWQQFLDRQADNKKWVETCEDSSCDSDYYEHVKLDIQAVFHVCADFLSQHPGIDRCTQNMRKFAPAWMRQHDGDTYGFTVDNHTYLSKQETPDKPGGMMKPPGAIVEALPDLGRVETAARKNGFKYLTHDSALGGFRTFVIVSDPQGRFDQWMLLNLQKGQTSVLQGTPLSVLTVQKKDAAGKALSKTRIHFRDYMIFHEGSRYELKLNEESNGKCYSCHLSGMRQLIARRTPILDAKPVKGEPGYSESVSEPAPADFAFNRLMEFNRRIRSYGAPEWDGMVIPENHGPALGKAQGCIDCHDGQSRGVLTVSTSHAQLQQKLLTELSMPPDTTLPKLLERKEMQDPALSEEESKLFEKAHDVHADLTQEFEDSRFPTLKKWFLETPCL